LRVGIDGIFVEDPIRPFRENSASRHCDDVVGILSWRSSRRAWQIRGQFRLAEIAITRPKARQG
jgi:hypothetical protein